MVGRYPYVEPSRCKTYEKGEQQLDEILKTGVTTFISLQVEQYRDHVLLCLVVVEPHITW